MENHNIFILSYVDQETGSAMKWLQHEQEEKMEAIPAYDQFLSPPDLSLVSKLGGKKKSLNKNLMSLNAGKKITYFSEMKLIKEKIINIFCSCEFWLLHL